MKPIRLVMSAFGSYGGVETISFEKMQKGIFLIAGDTGSGKSTIFDAIMFALYDRMSGKERKGTMMRSEYARGDADTWVEFTFSYGVGKRQEIYTITRYPAYDRRSKRKNKQGEYGITRQQGKVSLVMPDGSEFCGRTSEINRKIEEIIGLTAEQFSKIAMIAQGEFQELIMDKTGKRKEIFQQIFSTKIYEDIERKIWDRFRRIEAEGKTVLTQLKELAKGAQIPAESGYYEAWLNATDHLEADTDALQRILEEETAVQTDILQKEQKVLEDLKLDQKERDDRIRQYEEVNALLKKCDQLTQKKEECQKTLLQSVKVFEAYQPEYAEKSEQAARRIHILSQNLEGYAALENTRKKLHQAQETLMVQQETERRYLEQTAQWEEEKEKLEQSVQKSEDVSVRLEKALQQKKKTEELLQHMEKLYERQRDYLKETECEEKEREKFQKVYSKWEQSRRLYEEKYQKYISSQAAFLAGELRGGEPCPVCGSCEHPLPAKQSGEIVTRENLEQAKAAEQDLEKQRDQCQVRCEQKHAKQKTAEALLLDKLSTCAVRKGLSGDWRPEQEIARWEEWILSWKAEEERNLSNQSQQVKTFQVEQQERERGRKRKGELDKRLKDVSKEWEEMEQTRHQSELLIQRLQSEQELLQEQLEYDSEAKARQELANWKAEQESMEQKKSGLERQVQKEQNHFHEVQGAVQELEQQLNRLAENGKGEISKDALEKQYWEQEKTELLIRDRKEKRDQIAYRKQTNETVLERMKMLRKEQEQIMAKRRSIVSLNSVANGKVRFQTYIQRQYFKQIIQAANRRLAQMSSHGFLLQCRSLDSSGQGELGLDLDVYNPLTGKTRDAHTLSGGETFMASLAMALGMADVVQNTVGKTRLDTMFIDEGFGSLSEEVRNEAVKVLLELAGTNRLVGVISHVTELKDQIPYQLLVTKGNHGSNVKWSEEYHF